MEPWKGWGHERLVHCVQTNGLFLSRIWTTRPPGFPYLWISSVNTDGEDVFFHTNKINSSRMFVEDILWSAGMIQRHTLAYGRFIQVSSIWCLYIHMFAFCVLKNTHRDNQESTLGIQTEGNEKSFIEKMRFKLNSCWHVISRCDFSRQKTTIL